MFPPGHIALGYLTAMLLQRFTKLKFNILIVWSFSVLPDIDYFLSFLKHRGATHSYLAIMILVLISMKFRFMAPYASAYISHLLVDIFYLPGTQFLWPISQKNFVIDEIAIILFNSNIRLLIEAGLSLTMIIIMLNRFIHNHSLYKIDINSD
jgi:membrane-bound metal-dependent hydrolase YbcI (DUF457 family)